LLLFVVLIVLTRKSGDSDEAPKTEPAALNEEGENGEYSDVFPSNSELARRTPASVKPERWFRSNAGGMALEETASRSAAFRNEYALFINFIDSEELPASLLSYYESSYLIETRRLYEQGEEIRTQWIFRDRNETTRFIAAFSINSGDDEESNRNGFIEIYDENAMLLTDYRFFDNGVINKTEYRYKDGIFISAHVFLWDENEEEGEFVETYADFFRYNRSSFLRSVERVFYREMQISQADNSVLISFPHNIMESARNSFFMSEKLNPYPEFFGDVTAGENEKLTSTTDERGRILIQTFYDKEDSIIWFIRNTWLDDRIVSTSKTQGNVEILAEYEYDTNGNRILERNLRNGVLERLVITEGNRDIEQLYINDVMVMRAVWEEGRKISETRIRN